MDGPTCQRRKSEGFCTFVGRQRGRKSFSAFKAVALPPRAFVFCPGTRVILLLLKACMQIAVWIHVHERERQRAFSRGGRWFVGCTVPTIFYGRRPILLFFTVPVFMLPQFTQASILPSSASSRLFLLLHLLSFKPSLSQSFIQVCVRAPCVRRERGNACVLAFVRGAKL